MSELAGPRRRGSHGPSLRTLVRRAVVDHALAARGDLVLVACSGGPDSTALLHALASLRADLGIRLAAHGIDHGLRAAALAELEGVAELSRSLDVPFSIDRLSVAAGSNLQARARDARLDALRDRAARLGAQHVATGHTADDRAETLLMRMVRGTGVRGLGVLPPRAGLLVRPLFRARRADVLLHLRRHGVGFSEDPSNADPRFVRARVRAEILPLLATVSPRVVEALCALADSALELDDDPLAGLGRASRVELARAARRGEPIATMLLPGGVESVVTLRPAAKRRARSATGSAPVKKR